MAAQQLIPVFTGELIEHTTQHCNARDLHAGLKVETRFNDWIARRIDDYGFESGVDFWTFDYSKLSNQKKTRGGDRRSIDYRLTLDMAKELAMLENNDIGRKVRRYFIQCENELRAELRDRARHVLALPGIKSLHSGITFKQTVILQQQSRDLMKLLLAETAAPAQLNLHRQLRQVNDALGIPTDTLDEIVSGQPVEGA